MIFTGIVVDTEDNYRAGRIKVRLKNADGGVAENALPYAFPLLPKMFHSMPKKNEAVLVVCVEDNPKKQRFYLGPVISQYQKLYKDMLDSGALKMINGIGGAPLPSIDNIPDALGTFGKEEDVAIYGRKNSDIILSDSDLRIRCGVRLFTDSENMDVRLNRLNPSVIKLKYHETPLSVEKKVWNNGDGGFTDKEKDTVESSINVIAQEINLISTNGTPYVNTSNTTVPQNGNESISDDDIKKFIETAHPLPYGDELVKFLQLFLTAFKNHTHRYTQLAPVKDTTMMALDGYDNLGNMLSKNVRIN